MYAKKWIALVNKFGGVHHGYFLPAEGKDYEAFAIFSFDSLSAYENYREQSFNDEECLNAFQFAEENNIIHRIERQFMKPILE